MAHQRRSERDRDGRGGAGRRRVLAGIRRLGLSAAVLIAACDSPAPTEPGPGGSIDFPSGIVGGGDAVDEGTTLLGRWERFEVVQFEQDIVTTTVEWQFDGLGTCRRTITTFSAFEGFPRTTALDCQYDVGPLEITITFSNGDAGTFALSFPGFDPDRMLLDGFEYRRVS